MHQQPAQTRKHENRMPCRCSQGTGERRRWRGDPPCPRSVARRQTSFHRKQKAPWLFSLLQIRAGSRAPTTRRCDQPLRRDCRISFRKSGREGRQQGRLFRRDSRDPAGDTRPKPIHCLLEIVGLDLSIDIAGPADFGENAPMHLLVDMFFARVSPAAEQTVDRRALGKPRVTWGSCDRSAIFRPSRAWRRRCPATAPF